MATRSRTRHSFLSTSTWAYIFLMALTVFMVLNYVDLRPHVDNDFFFSNDDPSYQADRQISQLFERKDSQIIISAAGDIHSPAYQRHLRGLTGLIASLEGIKDVKSLTRGPRSVEDALASPLWSRLLLSGGEDSSNIIVLADESRVKSIIPKLEHLLTIFEAPDFHLSMSGFPYIVELIRRNLERDLKTFSSLAFLLFGLIVLLIFHSWRILIGMIVACLQAGALTFLLTNYLGLKIGILTANLTTIVFVLTLSHIIFLTFNWRALHKDNRQNHAACAREAVAVTIGPSFWSMFTTLLGFLSLLFVEARPLRELGTSGAIATLMAFLVAYGIFPSFLSLRKLPRQKRSSGTQAPTQNVFVVMMKQQWLIAAGLAGLILITAPTIKTLNTDPSLLSYFDEEDAIHQSLASIDQSGGSSPLVLVVKDKNNATLNTNEQYHRLMALQVELESLPDTGTLISLPILIAEAKRFPLAGLLPVEWLLKRMETPRYGGIARSFITADRRHGLFLFRMVESSRQKKRKDVIEEIHTIVKRQQFVPHLTGGVYTLQAHLSEHIASSLVFGLSRLILFFIVIALVVTHSFRLSLTMSFSIALVPLAVLGLLSYTQIPLDTISAPATNIAISMGIDAMIHMIHAYRRLFPRPLYTRDEWRTVCLTMGQPILSSAFIVSAGFAIFFFSAFPPTQRFGGAIVFGTVIAALATLFVFPLVSRRPAAALSPLHEETWRT